LQHLGHGLVLVTGLKEVDRRQPDLLPELTLLGGQTPTLRMPHVYGVPQGSRPFSTRHHAFKVNSAEWTCREQRILHDKMITVLNDVDVQQMLTAKGADEEPSTVVRQAIEQFRLRI